MRHARTMVMLTVITRLIVCLLSGYSMACCKSCESDCQDILDIGHTKSGVYHVTTRGTYTGYDVYCDMDTDGGGWVVFQRRVNATVDFFRDWNSYVRGFGDVSSEHWLGLNPLRRVLLQGHYELRIDMKDWAGETRYANYGEFMIGSSTENFKLAIGDYAGNAGDSMAAHNGQMFSSKDSDNDDHNKTSCAVSYKGAWWYFYCYHSNLNGSYQRVNNLTGIIWNKWKLSSLKSVEMKIRRV